MLWSIPGCPRDWEGLWEPVGRWLQPLLALTPLMPAGHTPVGYNLRPEVIFKWSFCQQRLGTLPGTASLSLCVSLSHICVFV